MKNAIAFGAGILFAAGLCISGMTDPMKVQNFLDFSGTWDPSLAFVMGGAILVHVGVARWALRAKKPLVAERFAWPELTKIDARLVVGAVLFGIGWGISGYCPGPALTSVGAASRPLLAFLAAMLLGTLAGRIFLDRKSVEADPEASHFSPQSGR
ncbi:MAG: YeeE/YedE family protein [Polyangiaceae bacterium]